MSLLSNDSQHQNQLASDWMHRGLDLLNESSSSALEQAVRCFDEAIALRLKLPLEENHFLRYGLSAGWINRGDALARLERDQDQFLAQAVKSYDEALLLLESLPLEENALYPRRLAIAWINRGLALQRLSNDRWESMECFREAIAVLEAPSAREITDRLSILGGAWANLAEVLMSSDQKEAENVRSAICKAIALVQSSEQIDVVSAEIGLKARHLLCRLAVRDISDRKPLSKAMASGATDAVDEAMALIRHWKFQGRAELTKLSLEIFRFGCRIYESGQPHFLAEFLTECLAPDLFGKTILPDQETLDAVLAAIWSCLAKLQPEGFQFVATPELETFLADIRELGKIEERLRQISPLALVS